IGDYARVLLERVEETTALRVDQAGAEQDIGDAELVAYDVARAAEGILDHAPARCDSLRGCSEPLLVDAVPRLRMNERILDLRDGEGRPLVRQSTLMAPDRRDEAGLRVQVAQM